MTLETLLVDDDDIFLGVNQEIYNEIRIINC